MFEEGTGRNVGNSRAFVCEGYDDGKYISAPTLVVVLLIPTGIIFGLIKIVFLVTS